MKADANATNAFLVGGLEPADARAGVHRRHRHRGRDARRGVERRRRRRGAARRRSTRCSRATPASSSRRGRTTGRASRSAPRTSARRRSRSEDDVLPPLEQLVERRAQPRRRVGRRRRERARRRASGCSLVVLIVPARDADLAVPPDAPRAEHAARSPRRAMVLVVGRDRARRHSAGRDDRDDKARDGPYAQTVALATARIDALRRQERREPHADRPRLRPGVRGPVQDGRRTRSALAGAHRRQTGPARAARPALRRATSPRTRRCGPPTTAATTTRRSKLRDRERVPPTARSPRSRPRRAPRSTQQATKLSDDLDHAPVPLLALEPAAARSPASSPRSLARRGIAQRLQEYR